MRGMCICCDQMSDDVELVEAGKIPAVGNIYECVGCRGSWKLVGRVLWGVGAIITLGVLL